MTGLLTKEGFPGRESARSIHSQPKPTVLTQEEFPNTEHSQSQTRSRRFGTVARTLPSPWGTLG